MSEPWFDPNQFGAYFGAFGGGVGGSLGGTWGALAGCLAPRGRGKPLVIGLGWLFVAAGIASLCIGVYALIVGQPYGIWYPLLLVGVIMSCVVGGLMPVVYTRYRQADERKLQAEEFRHA